MVVNLGLDPDWVWRLKGVDPVRRPIPRARSISGFSTKPMRFARKVSVRDFNTLNDHPLLIVYEGWFDKVSGAVKLEKKTASSAPLRSAA